MYRLRRLWPTQMCNTQSISNRRPKNAPRAKNHRFGAPQAKNGTPADAVKQSMRKKISARAKRRYPALQILGDGLCALQNLDNARKDQLSPRSFPRAHGADDAQIGCSTAESIAGQQTLIPSHARVRTKLGAEDGLEGVSSCLQGQEQKIVWKASRLAIPSVSSVLARADVYTLLN